MSAPRRLSSAGAREALEQIAAIMDTWDHGLGDDAPNATLGPIWFLLQVEKVVAASRPHDARVDL
jgi:hypothetical protein